jgi:hypothetical protein
MSNYPPGSDNMFAPWNQPDDAEEKYDQAVSLIMECSDRYFIDSLMDFLQDEDTSDVRFVYLLQGIKDKLNEPEYKQKYLDWRTTRVVIDAVESLLED